MHKKLLAKKRDFEKAENDIDYLQVILDKYNELWMAEPNNFMANFNNHQMTLLFYGVLYNQVQNGRLLQLIFNGYASYVFSEPLVMGLKAWGATSTAELINSIKDISLQVDKEIDKTSLESLSKSYKQYPEFENYDKVFYENDGSKEVKDYVAQHLSDFIMVK